MPITAAQSKSEKHADDPEANSGAEPDRACTMRGICNSILCGIITV
jgi:hypothetical protein